MTVVTRPPSQNSTIAGSNGLQSYERLRDTAGSFMFLVAAMVIVRRIAAEAAD